MASAGDFAQMRQGRVKARYADGKTDRRHRLRAEARHKAVIAPAAAYGTEAHRLPALVCVVAGNDPLADNKHPRRWWEILIVMVASGVFVWLAVGTRAQHIFVNVPWMIVLIVGTIIPLGLCGTLLWRRTRFS